MNRIMKSPKMRHPVAMFLCLCLAFCTIDASISALAAEKAENPAEPSEKRILRLVHPRFLYLDDLFLQLHPNVSFEYTNWDPSEPSYYTPYNNPIEEFRCDDPTAPVIDIYILSVIEGLPRLIREEYVLDLSSSESISAAYATYFPQAQAVLSSDGKPMAVPIKFDVAGWDYDKKTWDTLRMPSVPKTADELIQLINRWNQDIGLPPETALYGTGGLYPRKIQLLMDVINMYVIQFASNNAALNFDTPEFRDMVNRIINLPELPYCISKSALLCEDDNYPKTFSLLDLDRGDEYDPSITPILPMSFSENKDVKVGAEMAVVCIASNTQNRELAMEYVEFIVEHQAEQQKDLRAMLTLNTQEMDALGISKETQDFYCDLAPGITFDNGALGGFWPTDWQGEYFWFVFLDAYSLPDQAYSQAFWENLIDLMKVDIDPLIAKLNEEAQFYFANRY